MITDTIIIAKNPAIEDIYPFSILHCGWEVRCGALRIFEKYRRLQPGTPIRFSTSRQEHLHSFLARFGLVNPEIMGNVLVIDSSVLPDRSFFKKLDKAAGENPEESLLITDGNTPVAAFLHREDAAELGNGNMSLGSNDFHGLKKVKIDHVRRIQYLWDALTHNAEAVAADMYFFRQGFTTAAEHELKGAWAINKKEILIGPDTSIRPGVVIDASDGPVIIGKNVKIMPHATITGPCYIGDHTVIKIGAKIYGECSFGEYCKIGGEVENTIVQSYSNKQHDGFLGHAYIGEWVNLGADTNNSDLKNTYGNISVLLEDREIDTGRMFLGLLCGDHVKSAINTSFTTGTVAGICGILVHQGFLPRFIPSFSWGGRKDSVQYKADKAIEIARKVMERRGRQLLPEEEKLIRAEWEKSAGR